MSTKKDEERLSYMLGLLGRKREPEFRVDLKDYDQAADDSEYEDIYTNHQKRDMIQKIANPEYAFNPVASLIDDPYVSVTRNTQEDTEMDILEAYKENPKLQFDRESHLKYIKRSLESKLPHYYKSLDANHPWMMYWLANSYQLISDEPLPTDIKELINDKISRCIVRDGLGGIAGGTNQIGHAASTYAGILALVATENYELLDKIRPNLYKWFMSLKLRNGSFIMHVNGESDTRSTYCALSVAAILNITTEELIEGTAEWLQTCQTYEGGFAGVPNTEAHGGYSYCALASYFLLLSQKEEFSRGESFDVDGLVRWAVMRQYGLEGGLSGRTNKLVDACYSFWIGALYPLLESITDQSDLFSRETLGHYILRCSQSEKGGFRDKPGTSVDFYHTNYTLCGFSICESYFTLEDNEEQDEEEKKKKPLAFALKYKLAKDDVSLTKVINPVYGIPFDLANACRDYFVLKDQGK